MKFRKVKNCGPVPYPDQLGRYLIDEVVSGVEWEPLIALGFVEVVEESAELSPPAEPADRGKRLPDSEVKVDSKPEVKPETKSEYRVIPKSNKPKKDKVDERKPAAKDVIISKDKVTDAQAADRGRDQKMDSETSGRVSDIESTTPEDPAF